MGFQVNVCQNVEILDWARPDFCPASLQKFGESLREINLYWSGRNPVLRAWSEAEGLCKLRNLERINIVRVDVRPPSSAVVAEHRTDEYALGRTLGQEN